MHRSLKPLVALATGLVLVVLTAAPSAATLGTATAGTGVVNFSSASTVDLAPGGTRPCAAAAATTIDVTMTTATSGTATVDLIPSAVFPTGPTGAYGLLRLSGTATVTVSGSTITVDPVTLNGNVFSETGPGSCVPDLTAPRCGAIVMGGTVFAFSGSWSGTVTPPALSGTAVMSGVGNIAAAGCHPFFSPLNGKTMTVTGFTVPF